MTTKLDSPLDVAAILAQLQRTREQLNDRKSATARIATMNFVIFVDDPAHRSWVVERAARVTGKHPSRSIVLDSTGIGEGVELSTSVTSLECATVFNEHVVIGVAGLEHGTIVRLVHDLCVPGVPLFLWWSGARFLQSRTFSGLAEAATGVLLDSSGHASGEETIRELGDFPARFPHVVLRDLAFMRLAAWQDMIAQFFDDPALREDLFSIRSLHIDSGSDAEALYLAGWLGSRLSWEPAEGRTFIDRRGKRVPFTMEHKGGRRRILRVRLASDDSTYVAELSGDDCNAVCLHVEGAKAKPMFCMPLQNVDNALLVERAILTGSRDQIFETSLLAVRGLLR
ncbi:MAG: glucose-6-phosphate dehydrogenase assembly protein OpcA [Candidatus Baltobacteraceae bacterium]